MHVRNKEKEQRELERPLVSVRARFVASYANENGKPKAVIIQQLNVIKVGGAVVVKLDGMGS